MEHIADAHRLNSGSNEVQMPHLGSGKERPNGWERFSNRPFLWTIRRHSRNRAIWG